ncbi:hypothetical protein QE418_002089 [Microbacterium testaceum]|nr:hypothetical protein [Microbacterium testaceum]MDR6096820.1 hypothetical protein [Microbacterium sp. SORGH_AS_0454]
MGGLVTAPSFRALSSLWQADPPRPAVLTRGIPPRIRDTLWRIVGRMGTIHYGGSGTTVHIEDRALAHLKVVISTKLRRGESFTLSWRHRDDEERGRSTLWLHPAIPLRFVFDDSEPTTLSREWIERLADSANSSGGIMLVPEDISPTAEAEKS